MYSYVSMEKNSKHASLSPEVLAEIRKAQVNEVTEYHIYKHLSRVVKSSSNKSVLNRIADEELEHYRFWMKYNDEVEPRWWQVRFYTFIASFLGLVFALKMLERSEYATSKRYEKLSKHIPDAAKIAVDETSHEKALLNMLNDLRLKSFGTWLITMNLVLFTLAGLVVGLYFFAGFMRDTALLLILAGILVALSDSVHTLLLKNPGRIKSDQFVKALARMVSGTLVSALVSLPFFLLDAYLPAGVAALSGILLISLLINFYSTVVSDQKSGARSIRVLLALLTVSLTMALLGWALSWLAGV